MIRIRDLSLTPGQGPDELRALAAKVLRLPPEAITELRLQRRSIDARHKDDLRFICTVDVAVRDEQRILKKNKNPKVTAASDFVYAVPVPEKIPETRPVVVGFGPAGIFAALVLAEAGLRPIVFERGGPVSERQEKVRSFWEGGELDPECNVQFGEGGAGTFSDGKLTTGTKNERIGWVLQRLHEFGAQDSILYEGKAHIGTDVLSGVVQRIREHIVELGGQLHFHHRMIGLEFEESLSALTVLHNGAEERIVCEKLILAIGHSARDSFELLHSLGVPMEPKAFSMGVRIEHLQSEIDRAQYGSFAEHEAMPAADYKLAVHLPEGDAYTFCMCPGGHVVAAASEQGRLVTNGMSYSARDGENANAALLVAIHPEDFPYPGVLGGMLWQRELESRAFEFGGGNYLAPAQTVGDFLARRASSGPGRVHPSYRPGVVYGELHGLLGEKISSVLERAIPEMGRRLRGFDDPEALLTAVEARSSSPVRILRGKDRQSAIRGLFPCGEGAGYAGGIVSAAVDGMLCAEELIRTIND